MLHAIFLIPIITGVLTEALKFVLFSLKHGWDPRYALAYGHMPSAHTAFAVSTVTVVGFYEGITSPLFALAISFAIVVIHDALRLRVYIGEQSKIINLLTKKLNIPESEAPRLKERVGHKPIEVVIGAIFGIFFTSLMLLWF